MENNFKNFGSDFSKKSVLLDNTISVKIPILVGEMLVDGFRKSFRMQRFNDNGSAIWKQVKRRQVGNGWYGFNYRTNGRVPVGTRGATKKGTPKKFGARGGITNFSARATTRNILFGSGSSNLRDSIFLAKAHKGIIIVASAEPHAQVHNEGLTAKIFGRKSFTMPKRQFMGTSQLLTNKAFNIIENQIKKIAE